VDAMPRALLYVDRANFLDDLFLIKSFELIFEGLTLTG
jgi:hypothetical protein